MNIELKLNTDFERHLDFLKNKYGEDFWYINGVHPNQLDYSEFLSKFVQKDTVADTTIDPNANANHKDIRSFMTEKGKAEDKLFGLNKIFLEIKKKWGLRTAKDWLEQEFSKGFYLNDATTASFFAYCWANDLTRLAKEGLFFLKGYNHQGPKHLTTYFDDVIEFTSFLANRQSGAVGLPNVLIWAYYFWKKDVENGYYLKDPDTYLRQNFQKFIYRLNQPFMRIDQTSFTNVSIFDRKYLESLFGGLEFPDGSFAIDQIEELINVQKVFMEVVSEIRTENMFTFPVLTYSLYYKNGKFQDEDFARWCSDHNVKWSDSNFFVSDNIGVLSNCCRLLSETTELDPFINSIGGTALSVGSCRVSTMNLVRIAYEAFNGHLEDRDEQTDKVKAKFKERYLKILRDRTTLNCKALYSMRYILKRNIEKGLLPNYQEGAVELDKQFCTIGGIGLYEVMDLFGLINTDEFGNKSYSDEAIEFGTQILDVMNDVKDNFVKDYDCDFKFNIEMTPSENSAGVLCTADNLLFEQNRYFIYSNQWIPLMEKCTIQEKCRLGSIFDKKCGGGCIAHIDIEGRFPDKDTAWDMLNYVAQQGVIYFAFTTKISVCKDKHAFIGTNTCPVCGKPKDDEYMRVVGFYTPVSSYQKIRKKESSLRKWYNVLNTESMLS
jgi:ribonucleoside-triphosphate reductase